MIDKKSPGIIYRSALGGGGALLEGNCCLDA